MNITFFFGGYWWSQGPWRFFFFYKEKNGYWRRMYYRPNQWSANESNPIYLKWYWGGESSQTLVLKMKIEWEGGKWVPAEKARAEELSTKTACTLLLPDHSSKNFLYSAVISVKIPKTPRKKPNQLCSQKMLSPKKKKKKKKKWTQKRKKTNGGFILLSSSSSDLLSFSHSCNWNYVEGGRIKMILSEWGKIARQGLIGEMVPAFMAFRALGRSRVTIASPLAMTLLFTHSCTEEEAAAIFFFFFFFFQLFESSFSCSPSPPPKTYLLLSPTPIQVNKQTNNQSRNYTIPR